MPRNLWQSVVRFVVVLAATGLVTAFYQTIGFNNPTTVALSFLLVVLAVAARWGLAEAVVASVVATVSFNYFFLPPVGTLTIADPANWIALFAFLVVAVVASHLSEQAHRKAQEAIEHQQETERLYTLSRMILLLGGSPPQVAGEAPRLIQQIFGASGVTLFHRDTAQFFRSADLQLPVSDQQLKEIVLQGNVIENEEENLVAMPVSLGGKISGALVMAGVKLSDGARQAIGNLLAIALESAAGREAAGRVELLRQSEEFKSTLMDALAHELKTPLTSVKASVSALLANPSGITDGQRELLSIIEEETDRLTRLVTEALQMARMEAGGLKLEMRASDPGSLIRQAIEDSRRLLDGREVRVLAAQGLPSVSADRELVLLVLRHLLENAAKYSQARAAISIAAEVENEHLRLTVADEGPGVKEEELPLIFEKYYRGARTRDAVPGVGMGLSIAREVVIAHGGQMWAESSPGGGTQIHFTLPLAEVKSHA